MFFEVEGAEVVGQSVSAERWPVARANKQQRNCKRNIFVLSCYKE